MKKNATILMMSLFALLFSCQKNNPDPAPTENSLLYASLTVDEAKVWFDRYVASSSARTTSDSLTKEVDWSLAKEVPFGPEGKAVSVTVKYPKRARRGKGQLTKLVFKKNTQGHIQTELIKYYVSADYLKQASFAGDLSDFSGTIIICDWQERPLRGATYTKGERQMAFDFQQKAASGARVNAGQFWLVRVDFFQQTCAGGHCSGWTSNYSEYRVVYVSYDNDNYDFYRAVGGGGGSGGGSGGSNRYNGNSQDIPIDEPVIEETVVVQPATIIVDELNNPCLKQVLAKLQAKDLSADINRILRTIFGTNDNIELTFRENANLPIHTDGRVSNASLKYYPSSKTVAGGVTIELNPVALANASQEYMAMTILHETVHAYIDYRNEYVKAYSLGRTEGVINSYMHHDVMTQYVNELQQSLKEVYPNYPDAYARALAWGGLHETVAWQPLLDKEAILAKNRQEKGVYATKVGTPCR